MKENNRLEWHKLPIICKEKLQKLIESGYKEVPQDNLHLLEDDSNLIEVTHRLRYKSYIFEPLLLKEGSVKISWFKTTYEPDIITSDIYVCHTLKLFLMSKGYIDLINLKIDKEISQAKENLLKINLD